MENQEQFIQERINEFFEYFYNRKLYDYQGNQDHTNLGQVDVYVLKKNAQELIQKEKQHQIEHSYHGDHHHASHLVLESYNIENTQHLPKWLPQKVGIKTIQNISQKDMQNLKNQIDDNLVNYWSHCPEIAKVYGYQIMKDQFKSYIELKGSLDEEVQQRQQNHSPFTEQLLWKLLYSLIRGSHYLNKAGQNLTDIRPKRIYYDNYQSSVLPYGTGHTNDQPASSRLVTGNSFFYHQGFIEELNNKNNDQSLCNFYNESYQIGVTVLAAGLLKTENEISCALGNKFNSDQLQNYLKDFGVIYGNNKKNLQFTIQELLINPGRLNPSELYEILEGAGNHIMFLEGNFHEHLNHQYENQQKFIQKRVKFMQNYPEVVADFNFKQQYRNHYFIELKLIEYNEIKQGVKQSDYHHFVEEHIDHEEHVEQVKHAAKHSHQNDIHNLNNINEYRMDSKPSEGYQEYSSVVRSSNSYQQVYQQERVVTETVKHSVNKQSHGLNQVPQMAHQTSEHIHGSGFNKVPVTTYYGSDHHQDELQYVPQINHQTSEHLHGSTFNKIPTQVYQSQYNVQHQHQYQQY